jgi:hypothetical protein
MPIEDLSAVPRPKWRKTWVLCVKSADFVMSNLDISTIMGLDSGHCGSGSLGFTSGEMAGSSHFVEMVRPFFLGFLPSRSESSPR